MTTIIKKNIARMPFFLGVLMLLFFALPSTAFGEQFFVDADSDCCGRSVIDADFLKAGVYSMIFVEKRVSFDQKDIDRLVKTFDETIYPKTLALLGPPWNPGIDNDQRITILVSKLANNERDKVLGGYFNSRDEFSKDKVPASNEREMIYINADVLSSKKLNAFVAHEFQHLVRFNQKDRLLGKSEARWLDELRSEYMPKYLGFEDDFAGSNLEQRVRTFKKWPGASLTEWADTQSNYAFVNLFGQYLGDRFSPSLYGAMMKNDQVGIPSIENALAGMGFSLSFPTLFAQWRLANFINDPEILGGAYGYTNPHLTLIFNPDHTFSFVDLPKNANSEEVRSIIHPYTSETIRIETCSRPVDVLVAPEVSSPSSGTSLIAYVNKLTSGEYREVFSTPNTPLALTLGPDVQESFLLLANVSGDTTPVTFSAHALSSGDPRPCVENVQPLFENPLQGSRAIISGKGFEPNMRLMVNDQPTPFVYRGATTILADIPLLEGNKARLRIVNSKGAESAFAFSWKPVYEGELPYGSLVKARNDSKVYVIKTTYRRQLVSEDIFSFYGDLLRKENVKIISPSRLASYKESTLIRADNSPDVYELSPDKTKHWIKTEQEFTERGFSWDAIYTVNEQELAFYQEV